MKTWRVVVVAIFLFSMQNTNAQGKFYTKTGKISFYSSAPLENIEAVNKSVIALLDSKSGDFQFGVLMKGFEFKKALMQEHFNKSYIESDKYPKSEFKGQGSNRCAPAGVSRVTAAAKALAATNTRSGSYTSLQASMAAKSSGRR